MADIFVSYASEDRSRIEPLVAELEDAGYSVWWDQELKGGTRFSKRIEQELISANVVLVGWSSQSVESRWVADEAELAMESGTILPIALDGTRPPMGFRQLQTIDFSNWENSKEKCVTTLLDALNERLQRGNLNSKETAQLIRSSERKSDVTIAVLPFVNMSSDPENEYFADGLSEDIITGLSKSKHLSVISRTSTFRFKGQSPDVRSVGKDLNARYVVEGSVRPIANRVRITVQLIDATSGEHIWAEKYDRPADDLFEIQDEVIDAITASLGAGLNRAEVDRLKNLKPEKFNSWQIVQKSLLVSFEFAEHLRDGNWPGLEELTQVCQVDPNYAYAHSVLAWNLSNKVINGYSNDISADYREANQHLERALSLANDDPLNLHFCAYAMCFLGKLEEARNLCISVTELNKNYIEVYVTLGIVNAYLGRYDEAEQAFDLAEKLAPMGILFKAIVWHRANLRSLEGRHKEAEHLLRKVIQQWPTYVSPYYFLAIALDAQGRTEDAKQAVHTALNIYPKHTLERISLYLGAHPDPNEGKRRLELLASLWLHP